MRRAQALAAPQRGRRSPIPTAPLSLAGARPAAASPFRRPVPPPSLSQSRFESEDPWSRLELQADKSSPGRKRLQSKGPLPGPERSQSRVDSQDSLSRPEPEAPGTADTPNSDGTESSVPRESQGSWDELEAQVSTLAAPPTRWAKSLQHRPELEGLRPRAHNQRTEYRPGTEASDYNEEKYVIRSKERTQDALAKLQAEVSRLSAGPKGRWSEPDRSAYISEVKDLRLEEKVREKKAERPPDPESPVYLFSDLILDLGAEDAPGVRLYDRTDQEYWKKKWSIPSRADTAQRERLVKYIDNANSAWSAYRDLQKAPALSHWHIRQADVLSIALRGGPALAVPPDGQSSTAVDEATRATESLLHKNGIPRVTWGDDATLLWWMDAREDEHRPQPDDLPNLDDPKYTSLESQFDYGELRRLLSTSLSSGKGLTGRTYPLERQIHSICSDGSGRSADLDSCYNVVSLVMDVEEALAMAGKRLSTLLCWTGLEHATAGLYLGPAQHYLDLLIKRLSEAPDDRLDVKPIVSLCVNGALRRLSRVIETAPEGANLSPSALLKLLTGFSGGHSDVSPSFSQLMSYKVIRDNSFDAFVRILAKIGALRSLWQAWRFVSRPQQGQDDGNEINRGMDMFTLALVKERDAVLAYDLKRGQPTGDPAPDAQRDCESMPATWGTRSREDAWVNYPPELPFKIANALEMNTPDDAIEEIQRLMYEYPRSLDDANRDSAGAEKEGRRAEEEDRFAEMERFAKEEEQLGPKAKDDKIR